MTEDCQKDNFTGILIFAKISLANYETTLFAIMTCIFITNKLWHFTEQKHVIKTSKYLDHAFKFRFDVTVKTRQICIGSVNNLGKDLRLINCRLYFLSGLLRRIFKHPYFILPMAIFYAGTN